MINLDFLVRHIESKDAEEAGQIIYKAFSEIAEKHAFQSDIPNKEVGTGLTNSLIRNIKSFCRFCSG